MPSQTALLEKPFDVLPEAVERPQSVGEEWANSVSHGLGVLLALFATPFLLWRASTIPRRAATAGAAVYLAAMLLTYLSSALYHALPRGRAKARLRLLEHMMIFVMIAGTYTPFTLGVLAGPWGWTLFGLIWSMALIGMTLKAVGGVHRFPKLSVGLYVGMGWVVMAAIEPLWFRMSHWGFFWLFLGGLSYTGGLLFYALGHRIRYSHFIWHLFVLGGSFFQYIAIYYYAL